jgi:hypothetical protein
MTRRSIDRRFFRFCWTTICLLHGLGQLKCSLQLQAADATWRPVGAARVDITPEYAIRLSGYGNRTNVNTGISQRLFAKALVIGGDAEGPAILVTIDNCGVPASMREEVIRRLAANTKVQADRFALTSTHTHCAPMLIGVLPNLFGDDIPAEHLPAIERYTRELTDHVEEVARAALADRKPAQLAWDIGSVSFAANRRPYRLKPIDHALPVLRVTGEDGQVRALFASYACHCTTLDIDTIHGDWAGCAQAAIERDFSGAVALIALGAGADQNPMPRRSLELVARHGESFAAEVKRLVSGPLKPLTGSLDCQSKQIDLAFDTLPTREQWQALAQSNTRAIAYHARKNLARLDRGELLPTHLPYIVQTWSLGADLTLVFLAGEVVVDYSLRLKQEFDPARLWVIGYANDVPCYIPSRRVLDEGGYEGAGAMIYYDRPTRFANDVEDRIVAAVHDLAPRSLLRTTPPDPMELAPAPVSYPDHSQLMIVRDAGGHERPVNTPADWAERVAHIRADVQQVMGPLPGSYSSATVNGTYTEETSATINTGNNTIIVPITGSTRFYRVSAPTAVTIKSISVAGTTATLNL